jgi:hypothetical protein
MNNSNEVKANDAKETKNTTVVNGETVDTNTGEVLNQNAENKDEKKESEKRVMTESEAREYIASLPFKHLEVSELYETMQVPSCSRYEFRMAAYVIMWARRNGIDYTFDKKGNVYLTKGTLAEGEFYPCVTAHMDTVQDKAKPYALAGAELPLRTRRVKSTTSDEVRHEIFIDGQGIGADDKLGVYISLQLMKKFDKIKAVFFVEEEIGMMGSKELVKEWFDDVAYVIGWDSPDIIRGAWNCSGTQLFSKDFYEKHLKDIIKDWGFKGSDLHREPFTDVIQIREKTGITCMNFGNGGYNAHCSTEYLVIEHVDHAVGMGEDIIKRLGNKEQFKDTKQYAKTALGVTRVYSDDDDGLGRVLNPISTTTTHYPSTRTGSGTNTTGTVGNRSDGKVNEKTDVNAVNEETVKYIADTYDEYIKTLKGGVEQICGELEDELKDKFREAGIDFATLDINIKEMFSKVFSKEINF